MQQLRTELKELDEMLEKTSITIALIKKDVENIFEDIKGMVTKNEFAPVQRIVYGIVGLGLTALAVALFDLVIKK